MDKIIYFINENIKKNNEIYINCHKKENKYITNKYLDNEIKNIKQKINKYEKNKINMKKIKFRDFIKIEKNKEIIYICQKKTYIYDETTKILIIENNNIDITYDMFPNISRYDCYEEKDIEEYILKSVDVQIDNYNNICIIFKNNTNLEKELNLILM